MFRNYAQDEIKALQIETGVKSVFTQNAKMKRSSQNGIHLYNFGIPAFRSKSGIATCPNARHCVAGCYARSGAYVWSTVAQAYENRLDLTRTKGFEQVITYHIDKLLKKHPTGSILLRIHDSGDFYSQAYQEAWYLIASQYENNPRVQFYAYTKMVSQSLNISGLKPKNFKLIFSYGGSEDSQINTERHHHAKVFSSLEDLVKAGYVDGTHDDTVAALGLDCKIGLVYHGTKNYKNTTWAKVS
jgi:hypothetical protein